MRRLDEIIFWLQNSKCHITHNPDAVLFALKRIEPTGISMYLPRPPTPICQNDPVVNTMILIEKMKTIMSKKKKERKKEIYFGLRYQGNSKALFLTFLPSTFLQLSLLPNLTLYQLISLA